jgi:hypothetical protein
MVITGKGATMAKEKVTLALTAEALAIINQQTTERKRGDFVSACILDWERRQHQPDGGILERIEDRLIRIEGAVAPRQ